MLNYKSQLNTINYTFFVTLRKQISHRPLLCCETFTVHNIDYVILPHKFSTEFLNMCHRVLYLTSSQCLMITKLCDQ